MALPGWNSPSSVVEIHAVLEAAALIFFAALVVFDVLAHLNKKHEIPLERIGLICFGIAVLMEILAYPYSRRNDELSGSAIKDLSGLSNKAREDAGDAIKRAKEAQEIAAGALSKSDRATGAASTALIMARGARQEADSFEKDIIVAKKQAADAESHLEEALRRAAAASAELDRLKSPRSIANVSELVDALKSFRGTEFMFASVFADDESIQLLKQIDAALGLAGWKRLKQSVMHIGIPAIQLSGKDDLVNTDVSTAVRIGVDATETVETLQALPMDKLPPQVRIAVLLNQVIFSHLSPPEVLKPENRVGVDPGSSKVIRISVGKKP